LLGFCILLLTKFFKYSVVSYLQTYSGSIKSAVYLASPKSQILAVQSSETNIFAGFKSLWTIPALCM